MDLGRALGAPWLREPGGEPREYRPRGPHPWAYTLLLPLLAQGARSGSRRV